VEHLSGVTLDLLVEGKLSFSRDLLAREHLKWCSQCEELRLAREAGQRQARRERTNWWRRVWSTG
jgi:hypothetical protein